MNNLTVLSFSYFSPWTLKHIWFWLRTVLFISIVVIRGWRRVLVGLLFYSDCVISLKLIEERINSNHNLYWRTRSLRCGQIYSRLWWPVFLVSLIFSKKLVFRSKSKIYAFINWAIMWNNVIAYTSFVGLLPLFFSVTDINLEH